MAKKEVSKTFPKYVHIDMKGGPPTLPYFLEVMGLVKDWGGTGILVEWEDMFPWTDELSILARPGHYTQEDVDSLLSQATSLDIEVIPLIQTFGHMEFVLKHKKFSHLRDIESFPNCVRPLCLDTNEGKVRTLLREMIKQVIRGHGELARIHLGCDEVWCLGQSHATREHIERKCLSVTDIFLEHTSTVARIARDVRPEVKVMVWDDMMRTATLEQLQKFELADLVEPVIWSYGSILAFPPGMLERYQTVWGAGRVWGGSAWRGATGSNMHLTTVRHHVDNTLAWLSVMRDLPGMAGMVLTGWARYDHYATLCELLPVSLPSLRCCLAVLGSGSWCPELHKSVSTNLGLSELLMMEPLMFLTGEEPEAPSFPGSVLYSAMMAYTRLSSQFTAIMASPTLATWLNPWQLKRNFINPLQVQVTLEEISRLGTKLKAVGITLQKQISLHMHDFTEEEWINTNLTPKLEEIDRIVSQAILALK